MTAIEDQIRLGLRLVAEELVPPMATRRPVRPRRRLVVAAVGLALVAAAAVLAVADRGGSRADTRFLRDPFNFRPGEVVGPFSGKFLFCPARSLSGISAASSQDAWIVGSRLSDFDCTFRRQGLAWHWDGAAWRKVPTPKLRHTVDLYSVAAVADGEAWAVGARSNWRDGRYVRALVEHWDGHRWRVVVLPHTGPADIESVSADGPDDVWTLGTSFRGYRNGSFPAKRDRPLLLHWDGTGWTTVALPWARPGFVKGAKVVATGPADVWVVLSDRQIEHWDGTSWQAVPQPFGPKDPLSGFSATSADDAWAVGSRWHAKHSVPLAAHWNGQAWQIAPTPKHGTDSNLFDVIAVTPDDAWAVGESERLTFLRHRRERLKWLGAIFEHWDGTSWHTVPSPSTPPAWNGAPTLAASADGAAWVIGTCFTYNVLARWSGSRWTVVSHAPERRAHLYPRRGRPSCEIGAK